MSNLGSLVVSLEANIAKYTSDMGKAAAIAEQRMAQIDKTLNIVKSSMQALGAAALVGLTMEKVKSKIESAISSAAGLQELSERTGAAVEGLSGLASVAKLSGTDTEALATGLQKLSKSMNDAAHGGAANSEAFRAIGISTDELKGKKPDEMFLMIANRLATYSDGVGKTSVAQQLLGKSGANLLPVMKDLADVGVLQTKVTAEQAAMADEYEKNLVRIEAAQGAVYKVIAFQVLPVMSAFSEAMLESIKGQNGIKKSAEELAADNTIQEWAIGSAKAIGFVVDAFDGAIRTINIVGKLIGAELASTGALLHGDLAGAKAILSEYANDVDAIAQKTLFSSILESKLAGLANKKSPALNGGEQQKKASINFDSSKGTNPADDPTKRILDGRLKTEEAFLAAEKSLMSTREQFLGSFYAQEYMDANTYYSTKQALIADSLKAELEAYDREAAAVAIYIAQAQKLSDKQDGRNKLGEIAQKRAAAEVDANKRISESVLEQDKIYRDFDLATQAVAHSAKLSNDQAQFNIDMLGRGTLEVMKMTEAKRIQLALEDRLYQMRMKNLPEEQIAKAVADAEAQKAAAIDLVTQSYEKQRTASFGASKAMRKYAEDAGNQAAHMESAMTNAFKGMEDALVNFVKTGKLDFSSLADSIISDMIRMMVQQSIMQPLTKGYQSGGFSGLLSAGMSLFGYANGGDPPVGVPSIVGEHGPELFVPKTAGTIIPNGSGVALANQAPAVTVVQNFTVGDVASISMVRQAVANSQRQIVSAFSRSQNYGGAVA